MIDTAIVSECVHERVNVSAICTLGGHWLEKRYMNGVYLPFTKDDISFENESPLNAVFPRSF